MNKLIKNPIAIFVVLLFAGSIYIAIDSFFLKKTPSANSRRIAVLPFDNFSPDPQDEYIADGMTEELISRLSRVKDLSVIARTSIMKYKNNPTAITTIGNALNVGTILEGSIRKDQDKLRVTVQLIRVSDESHLWAQNYDRSAYDVFAIQNDIANNVADALEIQLLIQEKQQVKTVKNIKPKVHQLYLRGRYNLYQYTGEGFFKARDYFEQAIRLDPKYARAYAGLADSYYWMSNLYIPPKEAIPKAKAAAERALELDNTLAEAYTSLATISAFYDWDWSAAEKAFKQAIALNSNYASAYHLYGIFLCVHKRFDEAEAVFNKALQLDPLSTSIENTAIWPLVFNDKPQEAISKLTALTEREPNFFPAHELLGFSYEQTGDFKSAIAEYKKAFEISKHSGILSSLGYGYAMAGKKDSALVVLDTLLTRKKNGQNVPPEKLATIYLGLGDTENMFKWLENAYENRGEELVFVYIAHRYKNFHSHPRYVALMKKIGFD